MDPLRLVAMLAREDHRGTDFCGHRALERVCADRIGIQELDYVTRPKEEGDVPTPEPGQGDDQA